MAEQQAPRAGGGWIWALVLILASMLLYTINLDRLPHHDELYHMLAAQGLIETGEPRIALGIYDRGLLYTHLVAWSLEAFGTDLTAGRIPSLVAMGLLAGALFLFLHRVAGPAAAWIGTVLFALSPFAIDLAQFTRFYALQALAFFLGCMALYAALAPDLRGLWRGLALLLALPLLALAVHLQATSLIGMAGLGLWVTGVLLARWMERPGARIGPPLVLLAGLGVAGLAGLWLTGMLADLWTLYRFVPRFNEANADRFWFYHGWFSLYYPSLWPLTGILALAALAARPRPAAFVLTLFATGFLLNSFAASKSLRYIAYGLPFLFALWGIALAVVGERLSAFVRSLPVGVARTLPLPRPWPGRAATFLLAGALLFLLLGNTASIRSLTLLADVTVPPSEPEPDWESALPVLEPLARETDVFVTGDDLGAQFYLGGYDLLLHPSKFAELKAGKMQDFDLDPRTGRPVIEDEEGLEKVLACHQSGLFVAWAKQWGRGQLRDVEVEALIETHARKIELPPESRLVAFVWEAPLQDGEAIDCDALPPLGGREADNGG